MYRIHRGDVGELEEPVYKAMLITRVRSFDGWRSVSAFGWRALSEKNIIQKERRTDFVDGQLRKRGFDNIFSVM